MSINTVELTRLEYQIDTLIKAITRLKEENHGLKQQLTDSIQERASLQQKHQTIADNCRRLVTQLREKTA